MNLNSGDSSEEIQNMQNLEKREKIKLSYSLFCSIIVIENKQALFSKY